MNLLLAVLEGDSSAGYTLRYQWENEDEKEEKIDAPDVETAIEDAAAFLEVDMLEINNQAE